MRSWAFPVRAHLDPDDLGWRSFTGKGKFWCGTTFLIPLPIPNTKCFSIFGRFLMGCLSNVTKTFEGGFALKSPSHFFQGLPSTGAWFAYRFCVEMCQKLQRTRHWAELKLLGALIFSPLSANASCNEADV